MNILEHLNQKMIWPLHLGWLDLSITNGVITLWLAAGLTLLFFLVVSRRLKLVPGSLQNLAELLIQFITAEVAAQIEHDRQRWLPFLLALFSFILLNNLLSLVPGLPSATANINTTATLAIIVFIVVQLTGIIKKGLGPYFKSLIPSNIPLPIALFMVPIEIVSQLARPFSLAVRLFANMFAGHSVMLLIISLIFIFRSYLIIPLPVLGNAAVLTFEIFIGFIQAFVFTYLSALYIGTAQAEQE
jgi:F-type H+-transporting ATPase subunit a